MSVINARDRFRPVAVAQVKPCPFCGSGAVKGFGCGERFWFGCDTCGCALKPSRTLDKARAAWNRRV